MFDAANISDAQRDAVLAAVALVRASAQRRQEDYQLLLAEYLGDPDAPTQAVDGFRLRLLIGALAGIAGGHVLDREIANGTGFSSLDHMRDVAIDPRTELCD